MALSCLLVLRVAELVFNQRVATISALLWITYLFNLWLVKQPNTEVPFILLFYSAIWFFLRGINHGRLASFVTVGALLGVAALVRPIALFLPFVLVLLLLLQPSIALGRRFVGAFSIVLMFLIVILPWEIKLKSETNHVVPLSTNGPSSMLDGLTFAAKVGKAGDRAWVPSTVERLAGRVRENQRSLHTVGQVAEFMAVEARKDPLAVIEMGLMKIVRSWYGTNAMWHERPTALIQAFYLLLAIPGIWLAHRRFPEKRFLILSLLAIVIYFWAMTVMVLSILRYMVPAMGILLMFGAVSLDSAFTVWGVIWKQKAIVAHRQAETSARNMKSSPFHRSVTLLFDALGGRHHGVHVGADVFSVRPFIGIWAGAVTSRGRLFFSSAQTIVPRAWVYEFHSAPVAGIKMKMFAMGGFVRFGIIAASPRRSHCSKKMIPSCNSVVRLPQAVPCIPLSQTFHDEQDCPQIQDEPPALRGSYPPAAKPLLGPDL